MIRDGFFPTRDHSKAIFDTFRSSGVAPFPIGVTALAPPVPPLRRRC
ncbi:MAG TPA: hypothetical protein VGQ76_25920 [Thermoanaerobaculia bacterium]|jgi:hypothetical protein|nr:hypothetical protein [Thermoanaerobaculia bacterium]